MIHSGVDLAYVEFYVSDAASYAAELRERFGFETFAVSTQAGGGRSIAIRQHGVLLAVTEPTSEQHRAAAFLVAHGDGVADITLYAADVPAAFARAMRAGARSIAEPAVSGGRLQATISAFGDLSHTLVQVDKPVGVDPLPGFARLTNHPAPAKSRLRDVDHIAICLEPAMLDPAVAFYRNAFGFHLIYEEDLSFGDQGMRSKVVRSQAGRTTLTLLEPDPAAQPGQITDFLTHHGGPGVQHIAFATEDIVDSVDALSGRGLEFLKPPATYYELLPQRFQPDRYTLTTLQRSGVLVDQDHDGQLFQIFTRSTHVRRTLFFELVERRGASTFGTNNIRALYEAVRLDDERAATPMAGAEAR